jgi:hypothetical protein
MCAPYNCISSIIVFLLVALLGGACTLTVSERESERSDESKLLLLREKILIAAAPDGCSELSSCKSVPVGINPCGGPSHYVAYCGEGVDEGPLRDLIDEYNSFDRYMISRYRYGGLCIYIMPPPLTIKEGVCYNMEDFQEPPRQLESTLDDLGMEIGPPYSYAEDHLHRRTGCITGRGPDTSFRVNFCSAARLPMHYTIELFCDPQDKLSCFKEGLRETSRSEYISLDLPGSQKDSVTGTFPRTLYNDVFLSWLKKVKATASKCGC